MSLVEKITQGNVERAHEILSDSCLWRREIIKDLKKGNTITVYFERESEIKSNNPTMVKIIEETPGADWDGWAHPEVHPRATIFSDKKTLEFLAENGVIIFQKDGAKQFCQNPVSN